MGNIIEYIKWRGDLTFRESSFNQVDNLILATLSYATFKGIVPEISSDEFITVKDAARQYSEMDMWVDDMNSSTYLGEQVLMAMADSKRYSRIKLSKFTDIIDEKLQMQFSAIRCALYDNVFYIAFRGTDDFLIGWKEDFALSFERVKAQEYAVDYINQIMENKYRYYLGGHSKGGNLAIYAGMNCESGFHKSIINIFNNDGPGICDELLDYDRLELIKDKIIRIIPEFSIIGMLFNKKIDSIIVQSNGKGLLQHNPYTWQVIGDKFLQTNELDKKARLYNEVIDKWIEKATLEQRRIFTEDLFSVIGAGGAKLTTQLPSGLDKLDKLFKALIATDDESKKMVRNLFDTFADVLCGK